MRFRKRRSILIKQRHIKIFLPILVLVIVIVVIVAISAANKPIVEKQRAIAQFESVGIINIGFRGDIGVLSTYNSETGEFEGLEKDIADEIISRVFADRILVNFIDINSQTKKALLRLGDLDIAFGASLEMDESGICYSSSYFSDGSAFLVTEGTITKQQQLSGGTIGIVQGSMYEQEIDEDKEINMLEAYLHTYNIEADIKLYASYPEAIAGLRAGFVDAVCANEIFLKLYGKKGMIILPERFISADFSIAVCEKSQAFCAVLDDTINAMQEDGTIDALLDKYNLINYDILEE